MHDMQRASLLRYAQCIIKAHGQFAGFSGYPHYDKDVAERLQETLDIANNDSDRRQATFRKFVQNAIDVAAAPAIKDPSPTGLYAFRTIGHGSPGANFDRLTAASSAPRLRARGFGVARSRRSACLAIS